MLRIVARVVACAHFSYRRPECGSRNIGRIAFSQGDVAYAVLYYIQRSKLKLTMISEAGKGSRGRHMGLVTFSEKDA
jgi:hypothetical protein